MSTTQRNSGTSRQEQFAETRQKLLDSAKALFAEKGYHGTSVRNINRALSMSDGILYHYFPGGKKEILSVLLQESFALHIQKLTEHNINMDKLPLDEALHKIFMLGDELFSGDLALMKILFRESDVMELKEIPALSSLFEQRLTWLADFLQKRYQKGEIRNMNFEMAAQQFMSMSIINIVNKLLRVNLIGDFSTEDYRKQAISYILDSWKTS